MMAAEEYALVLDFMPQGSSKGFKSQPLAQVIGVNRFTLLEVVTKEGVELKPMEKVYVGKDTREQIEFIKRRITFDNLTTNSQSEIEKAIDKIVDDHEKEFVRFFNESSSISVKRHKLELLPGIGQKHTKELLKLRRDKPFESFEDIAKRVSLIPNPKQAISKRVLEELEGSEKYYLFVRPPISDRDRFGRGGRGGFRRQGYRPRPSFDRPREDRKDSN